MPVLEYLFRKMFFNIFFFRVSRQAGNSYPAELMPLSAPTFIIDRFESLKLEDITAQLVLRIVSSTR
jgi:hypothetical protein